MDDLLDKLLFMAVSDDGECCLSVACFMSLTMSRSGLRLTFSHDIPSLRESTQHLASHAEADAGFGPAIWGSNVCVFCADEVCDAIKF